MSSNIFADLSNASKALTAQRFGVTTAGTNLANVNNPDYARQRVIIGEDGVTQTLYGPKGLGVEVQGFEHARDVVLDREVLREASIHASLENQLAALEKAQANLGQEIDRTGDSSFIDGSSGSGSGGIAETINDFFNQLHALSANPTSAAEKESLVQKAQVLTEKFNVTAERFTDLKDDLTLQAETDLGEANDILKEIARLNAEISRAEASSAGQALSLRDQRQALLEDLSGFVQVRTEEIDGSAGQIRVFVPRADGEAGTIDLVNKGRYEQLNLNDDNPVRPVFEIKDDQTPIEISGGSIHGLMKVRNETLTEFETNLDNMAVAMVEEINALYSNNGLESNFFDAAGTNAATFALDSTLNASTLRTANTATSTGDGDNTLVLALAELDSSKVNQLGGRSFSEFYRSVVTDLAEDTASVESRLEDEAVVFDLLKQQQDAVSGVSIDEEMTDMMKYQRAFEANAKLIKAIDEMLDVIVNRLV